MKSHITKENYLGHGGLLADLYSPCPKVGLKL